MLKFLLKRKIIIGLFIVFIFAFGLYGMNKLDKELFPAVEFNQSMIMVDTEEMPAEDVEQFVTIPIEKKLDEIEGVKNYESVSEMTSSLIMIEVNEKDAENISQQIENEVNQLRGELNGVRDLMVMQATTSAPYEMFLDISGADATERDAYAKDIIEPRLGSLKEVRDVQITGMEESEIQIIPKKKELEKHELTQTDIANAIENADKSITLGTLKEDSGDSALRWNMGFKKLNDIKQVPLETKSGIIKLSEIATVNETTTEQTEAAWKNGSADFLLVQIGRAEDVSQIDMAAAVRNEVKRIEAEVESPAQINEIAAQADYVEEAIDGVTSNIIIGGIIAVIVLLLFLRNIRATIIIGLSIPSSILLTILTMSVLDYSFNLLSLVGLGLGIGMMVDASIVVLESIFRKKELGFNKMEAVVVGTKEVAGAVISSALTTIVVFIPIVLMDDEVGKMVIVLTVVVASTLISSVIVAFTLIPALSENFLKVKKEKKIRLNLIGKYESVLEWITKKKRRRFGIVGLFLVLFFSSFLLLAKIPITFMPDILNRYAEIGVNLEPGVNPTERAHIAKGINEALSDIKDVESNIILPGGDGFSVIINMTTEEDKTMEQDEVNEAIFDELRELESDYPITSAASLMDGETNPPVEIRITGEELNKLQTVGKKAVSELEEVNDIASAKLQLGELETEYEIDVNKSKAKEFDLPETYLFQEVSQLFFDQSVGYFKTEGENLPITLESGSNVGNKNEFLKQKIMTPDGEKELSSFISVSESSSQAQIERSDGERYVSIHADYEGNNLGKIHADIDHMLKDLDLEPGYSASIAGDLEEQQQAATDLIFIFLISLFLVFVVMAIQFNSLKHPLIILFIIPVTLTGVLIGLFLTQKELNVLSAIGVIMLIGIVINNGILLIDRARQHREQSMDVKQAIVESGKERIRPIFMTTLTTIGGMLPLALATGASSGYQSPLAVVIISGLLFSTLITLVLIPALYLLFEDMHSFIRKVKTRKSLSKNTVKEKP